MRPGPFVPLSQNLQGNTSQTFGDHESGHKVLQPMRSGPTKCTEVENCIELFIIQSIS